VTYLPAELYGLIEESLPIACVDFVPLRGIEPVEVGLILRDSPFGRVWCHLGGRIQRGETLADALRRHARETVGVDLELLTDPQPDYVYQWFPAGVAPTDGTPYGRDPRKHSIALSFVTTFVGVPFPQNEALDFSFFPVDDLPKEMWPGSGHLINKLLAAYSAS
jgi:ADP-ribose pyrophosphatase YjhB (NUDIX family)